MAKHNIATTVYAGIPFLSSVFADKNIITTQAITIAHKIEELINPPSPSFSSPCIIEPPGPNIPATDLCNSRGIANLLTPIF